MDTTQELAKYQNQAKKEKQSTNNPHPATSKDKLVLKVLLFPEHTLFFLFVESLDDS